MTQNAGNRHAVSKGFVHIGCQAVSYECPVPWHNEGTQVDLTPSTLKNAFSVVDLGMSFIIY